MRSSFGRCSTSQNRDVEHPAVVINNASRNTSFTISYAPRDPAIESLSTNTRRTGGILSDEINNDTDRRTFMKQVGGAIVVAGMDARSYGRVLGSNGRIRLGQLGCGGRSEGHVHMAQ